LGQGKTPARQRLRTRKKGKQDTRRMGGGRRSPGATLLTPDATCRRRVVRAIVAPVMKPEAPQKKPSPLPRYRPLSRRRRLLLLGVAVATACAVMALMLQPRLRQLQHPSQALQREPAQAARAAPRAAAAPSCAPGQTRGCLGGLTQVIAAPASGALSRREETAADAAPPARARAR
jgi:hypothetical protein